MKVVAFNGSPRKDGNTTHMINRVFSVFQKEGIDTELIQVGGGLFHGLPWLLKKTSELPS